MFIYFIIAKKNFSIIILILKNYIILDIINLK